MGILDNRLMGKRVDGTRGRWDKGKTGGRRDNGEKDNEYKGFWVDGTRGRLNN